MAMTIWNETSDFERRLNDLFGGFAPWPRPAAGGGCRRRAGGARRRLTSFAAAATWSSGWSCPGSTRRRDVKVTLQDGDPVIGGQRQQRTGIKDEDCHRIESLQGSFERRLRLPEGAGESKIRAGHRDGILEVVGEAAATATSTPKAGAIPIEVRGPK